MHGKPQGSHIADPAGTWKRRHENDPQDRHQGCGGRALKRKRVLIPIFLILSCLSCIHIPKGPYQDVVYSNVFQGRDRTTLLGEIELEKGNKYYYRVKGVPYGHFDVGIYFKSPWFPDNEFPNDAKVKISVYENKRRLCAFQSSLSGWSKSPWGSGLINRCLTSPLQGDTFYEIEKDQLICEYRRNEILTYDIFKETDLSSRENSNLLWSYNVLSKKGRNYVIVFEIIKGDPRAEKLNPFAGITCSEGKPY